MITKVWLHRFNDNELGISEEGTGRGAFVLVPKDARKLLPSLSEENEFKTTVRVYVNKKLLGDNNYSKPPSKSEYRLSLAGIGEYSGEGELLSGGQSVVIHGYDGGVNISTDLPNETIEPYLREFSSRTPHNNTVLSITHEVTGLTRDVVKNTLSKPFILLAGISGTGKSRFVREQAISCWQTEEEKNNIENFELVSVRPDWHEPSDLLGYVSRLGQDGAEFITTDVLRFMVKAWLSVIDLPNSFGASEFDYTTHDISKIPPFWLCLDEMNLAPVEQYFADYLSVIETRKWEEGVYTCDPLLKPDTFNQLEPKGLEKLREALGLKEPLFDGLWRYFVNKGISIPFNLIVAGTVNMDETTHGFSRKVIDRALTFDFGEFFPNNSVAFFEALHEPKALGYPLVSHAKLADLNDVIIDSDGKKTRAFFDAVNHVLKGTMFELAYRALNELFVSVISFNPKTDVELQAVWDDFLMMKVLPRIEGDEDKLSYKSQTLLEALITTLQQPDCLQSIWKDTNRPDLFRQTILSPQEFIRVPCRSSLKLEWMQHRLQQNGFTSFWP